MNNQTGTAQLSNVNWHHVYGKPDGKGLFKSQPKDFIVTEQLGYSPKGQGEHIYVWLQKQNLNTAFVAEQLAKYAKVPLRNVSFAGRKDKYALTHQWFGVHLPGNREINWDGLVLEGARVLCAQRHNKKLRTGVLKGNRFEVCLRNATLSSDFEQRIENICHYGVPNYFAEQRFGVVKDATGNLILGGNLALAERMLEGEVIRNRNKRSMAISALRSWIFNQVVSERVAAQLHNAPILGDAIKLAGSNSFFIAERFQASLNSDTQVDPTILKRLAERDVELTAPMVGKGDLASKDDALLWEKNALEPYDHAIQILADLDLKQERRALMTIPRNLEWQFNNHQLSLCFDLPSGCYATAVLRELIQYQQ